MNQDQHTRLPAFIVLLPEDIAARAYELYLQRAASDGFDRDDWFRAEQELKARGEAAAAAGAANEHRLSPGVVPAGAVIHRADTRGDLRRSLRS